MRFIMIMPFARVNGVLAELYDASINVTAITPVTLNRNGPQEAMVEVLAPVNQSPGRFLIYLEDTFCTEATIF